MSIIVKVAELLVNVTANAGGFIKPVKDSRKELKGFSDEAKVAKTALYGLKSSLALIGGGLSFAAAIASARSYARELDSLGKVAAKVGIGTDSLSALRFGGEQSGLDPRVIDVGLQKLSQRISEARRGAGEAAPVLKELNINLREMSELPADKQLERIADAMLGVANQGDKIRIATKLFEEEGVGMLNLLKDGSSGLRRFREEARQLGIDFSTETVAGVEAANDAINRLKTSLGSLGSRIVIELAPDVERVANKVTKFMAEYDEGNKLINGNGGGGVFGGTWSDQFKWTVGAWNAYKFYFHDPIKEGLTRKQLLQGKVMGGDGAALDPLLSTTPPDWFTNGNARPGDGWNWRPNTQAEIDAARAEEHNRQMEQLSLEKGLSYLVDQGIAGAKGWADWAKGDGLKQLTSAAKTIADTQEKIRDGLRGAAWESIIRPPGWTVEREQHEKDRQERKKQLEERRRELESKLHPSGPTAINSAIERYSAEAYRTIAENKVAKAHLDVARESKRLLEAIDAGIDKIEVTTTGI